MVDAYINLKLIIHDGILITMKKHTFAFFVLFTTLQAYLFLNEVIYPLVPIYIVILSLVAAALDFYGKERKISFLILVPVLIFALAVVSSIGGGSYNFAPAIFGYFALHSLVAIIVLIALNSFALSIWERWSSINRLLIWGPAILGMILFTVNAVDYYRAAKNEKLDYKRSAETFRKENPELYFSVGYSDGEKTKDILSSECGNFFSFSKRRLCFKHLIESVVLEREVYLRNKITEGGPATSNSVDLSLLPLCERLPDTPYNDGRKHCYRVNAVRVEQCQRTDQIDECLHFLAMKTDDPKACFPLVGEKKGACLFEINKTLQNPMLCELIEGTPRVDLDYSYRSFCFSNYIESGRDGDARFRYCPEITSEWKEQRERLRKKGWCAGYF